DPAAEAAVRANLRTAGFEDSARFERSPVSTFVAAPAPEAPFDLVFLDPPYDHSADEVIRVLTRLAANELVTGGGTVVVERPKSGEPLSIPDGWEIERERVYGDARLLLLHA